MTIQEQSADLVQRGLAAGVPGPAGVRTEAVPYRWHNARGEWVTTTGLLHLPAAAPAAPLPLLYVAGYEASAEFAQAWVARGVAVASTRKLADDDEWPHGNALGRGTGMDEALLRTLRALPVVDDRRIVLTGGSAGGYMALLLAAATFPVAGAAPIVPPLNLPYEIATWQHAMPAISALRADGKTTVMAHPGSPEICAMWTAVRGWHGDPDSERLWRWSPLAHLDRITCPVVLTATSADALVPVPQVGGPLVAAAIAGAPDVYPIDAEVTCPGPAGAAGRRTLLGLLDPAEVQVEVLAVPPDTPVLVDVETPPSLVLPAPARERRWLVVLLDEGPPGPDVGHFRYQVGVDVTPLIDACLAAGPAVEQLTPAKLDLLADRFLGRDWITGGGQPRPVQPEELAAERADVVRGLRVYCATSPAHAERYESLTAALTGDRRALADAVAAG